MNNKLVFSDGEVFLSASSEGLLSPAYHGGSWAVPYSMERAGPGLERYLCKLEKLEVKILSCFANVCLLFSTYHNPICLTCPFSQQS